MRVLVSLLSAQDSFYHKILQDFATGIQANGDRVLFDETADMIDVAIIFGTIKTKRGRSTHLVKKQLADKFRYHVQIETPLVGRTINPLHSEFRVGINGFMWDNADWGFSHMTSTRPQTFWSRFKYEKKDTWNDSGNHILICMQKWGDASLGDVDTYEWCRATVNEIRKYTQRPIMIRPHPIYRKKLKLAALKRDMLQLESITWRDTDFRIQGEIETITQDLKDCWCTVTHTSGSAVDSVLNGVPNIATGTGNMAWPVSGHSLSEIESPYRGDKTDWLNKIAHCQWSVDEFRSGLCWEHVRKGLRI